MLIKRAAPSPKHSSTSKAAVVRSESRGETKDGGGGGGGGRRPLKSKLQGGVRGEAVILGCVGEQERAEAAEELRGIISVDEADAPLPYT